MKRRMIAKNLLIHCYQRSVHGNILFYCYSDYLVYFTGYCIQARKHHVQVLSLCLMPDHVHDSIIVKKSTDLMKFKRDFNTWYSRVHKPVCHCKDEALLETPYGSAIKYGAKKARTLLIYVGNNPVERQLAAKAEDYRWNFLAYAQSDHPFSKKLILRQSRWSLRQAIKEVNAQYQAGKPLSYAQLQRLFKKLEPEEGQQLTDYIIRKYNVIDYPEAIRYFDRYEDMLSAMHSTTGSEYDINEPFLGKSDAHYARMTAIIMRERHPNDIHDILGLDIAEKFTLFQLIRKYSSAMSEQIAKFLHMPMKMGPVEDPLP